MIFIGTVGGSNSRKSSHQQQHRSRRSSGNKGSTKSTGSYSSPDRRPKADNTRSLWTNKSKGGSSRVNTNNSGKPKSHVSAAVKEPRTTDTDSGQEMNSPYEGMNRTLPSISPTVIPCDQT